MSGAWIGVDPGCSGAVAVVSSLGRLEFVEDIESVEKGVASPELTRTLMLMARGVALSAETNAHHVPPSLAGVVVERVGSMPGQGVSSTFKFGTSYGIALGCAAMLAARIVNPTPTTWKRAMGLSSDKNASRAMAIRLWPDRGDWFKRVKDADRAEAALMAEWGRLHAGR
jgi:hypothetical protein